ncbi:MAG: PHB depolymerase family esterase [Hyphomonadaceae bacterium]
MTRLCSALQALITVILATLTTLGAALAQTYDRDIELRAILHNGDPRGVGLYVPSSYRAGQPAPLIVALHGRFSSPKAMHAITGLAAVAEARGAIILYPESLNYAWNDGGHALLNRPGEPIDDLGFVATAIEAVADDYAIDRSRIYLTGFDSGGAMAYALACQGAIQYAGVAVVSALMWDFQRRQCASARATPMLIVHGRRDDQYTPIRGGEISTSEERRLGVDDTVAVWRQANGCEARASAAAGGDSALYTACASGAPVAYVGVDGGAHDWFHVGERYQLNRQGVDATSLLDTFFFNRASFALPRANSSGRSRSWIVYAPSRYDPTQPTPVVVLLHGRPGNAGGMAFLSGMNSVAENNNFIVVYPDGIDNEWNAQFDLSARSISLTGRRSTLPQDDVGFLQTLMDDIAVDFNIDRSRLYLGGFSNGGFMTYRMACSAADTFAAFAAVSGNLYMELSRHCQRSPPTPILIMNGTADPSVPYEGVLIQNPTEQGGDPIRISYGVQDGVALLARRNGCSLSGESTTFAEQGESPGTHIVRFKPHGCEPGKDVVLYMINGGGHTWPGHRRLQTEMGATNMDMDAGEVIWDFFAEHALAPAGRR